MKVKWEIMEAEGFTPLLTLYVGEDRYVCSLQKNTKSSWQIRLSSGEIDLKFQRKRKKRGSRN